MLPRRRPPVDHLTDLGPFKGCTRRELEAIVGASDVVGLPAEYVLTKEGSRGVECFVIVDGEASVRVDGEEIAVLGRGALVGEMSLIDGCERSATVVAITPMQTIVFSRPAFKGVLATHPAVASAVLETLALRLRSAQAA
jgi:CRP/FNR family transcriptional regulator, cyclic AMP receptor protein